MLNAIKKVLNEWMNEVMDMWINELINIRKNRHNSLGREHAEMHPHAPKYEIIWISLEVECFTLALVNLAQVWLS